MTLPASGVITLTDIQTEFGGSAPTSLSEYYRSPNGLTTANNTSVPLSGPISMSNFYGAVNVVPGNSGILTSGSSFTLPITSGLTIKVLVIAGGGGGGGGSARTSYSGYFTGGGGGGAGGNAYGTASVTPGQSVTIFIGGGGAGGAARDGIFSGGSNGSNGITSSVTVNGSTVALVTAGNGGIVSPNATGGAAGGASIGTQQLTPIAGYAAGSNTTAGGIGPKGYTINTTVGLALGSIIGYGSNGSTSTAGSGVYSTSGTVYGAGGSGGGCAQSDVENYANIISTAGTTGAVFIWWGY